MIRGLYRTWDRLLGDSVRVSWAAGDAAPVLRIDIYQALGGEPALETLPHWDGFTGSHGDSPPDRLELL